jgi:hypothetical protein
VPISDIVNVVISVESAQLEREGFGVPCILGFSNRFADTAREYTSVAGMVTDGFLTTDVEYRMASAIFAQSPRPPRIVVARRANKPTMRWAVTPVAANSTVYSMKVNGNTVSYTSDADATLSEIIAGLKTAIDALNLDITVSDQTTYMRIVADAAGTWFSVEPTNPALIGVAQDHADAGIATDLNTLIAYNNTWYGLLSPDASSASIAAAAAWVETNKKLYIADSQDTEVEQHVASGATDIAATLEAAAYARTALAYHRNNAAFFGSAWMGRVFTIDAGSETWAFKELAGVPVMTMTDTQAANVKAKNGNTYVSIYGRNLVLGGTTASGEYVDVTRGSDWLRSDIGERVFLALTEPNKLPFTDGGIAVVKNQVRASLAEAVSRRFLSEDPAPTVTAPLAADVSSADKAARLLPDVNFEGVLAGAIHSTTITGVVRA